MARHITHRALDGTRIKLAGDLDLSRPYTSVARVEKDGRLHEVSSGSRRSARAWAEDIGVERFEEEFRVQDGRLRIGRATHRDGAAGLNEHVLAAVWEGRGYAVFTHLYHARAAHAVAFFDALTVDELDDGVAIAPRGRRPAAFTEPAELVKEVPGLGLLEITSLTRQTARRLPPWSGARVGARSGTGGELFKDSVEGQGVYFLLATASALVTVIPERPEAAGQIPGRLAGLAVEAVRR